MNEYANPVIIVSDGGPVTVIETSHDEIMDKIRAWHRDLSQTRHEAVSISGLHDRYAMAEAALDLIETDQDTGISLEVFGAVGGLVGRVVAYAFGHDPHYTTVHWPVH